MINESKALGEAAPIEVNWIYDGITLVLALIIKPTWVELVDIFQETVTTQDYSHSASVRKIIGTYGNGRIKNLALRSRVVSGRRIFILSEGKAMSEETNYSNDLMLVTRNLGK